MLTVILVLIVVVLILQLPTTALIVFSLIEVKNDFKHKRLNVCTDAELVEEQKRRLDTIKK